MKEIVNLPKLMELKSPQRKRRPRDCPSPQPSFPITTESRTGIPATAANWHVYTGIYNGDCVVVEDKEEMARINSQGYFGKGSLSRNFPKFDRITRGIPPFIRERQWQRRCKWANIEHTTRNLSCNIPSKSNSQDLAESLDKSQLDSVKKATVLDSEDKAQSVVNTGIDAQIPPIGEGGRDVVVLNDSDSECDDGSYVANLTPRTEKEPCSVYETLHLSLEEAFFLSYALGCLKIFDLFGNNISLTNMWRLFIDSQKDFIENYVVYHYFRAKGWIVKPGLKFGGDFVLYKQGPPHYHGSYIVKVEVIKEDILETRDKNLSNPMKSWTRLLGLNRLAETAAKELLLCQVVWPAGLTESELRSPRVLPRFTVYEVLVRRWVAARERDREDNDL